MKKYIVRYEENRTIRPYSEYILYTVNGKGVIKLISFVASDDNVFLKIKRDNIEHIEYPNVLFFYNAGLTTRNKSVFCHIYDTGTNKYGLIVEQVIDFDKKIEINLVNETGSSVTIKQYIIIGEVEV